jgi:DNA-binding PadR family transcriptional regulator
MKTKIATEFVLLGALLETPKHGYEIMQFLDSALGSTWQVSMSQLYVLVKRLEREGLLKSGVESQDNRPSKRVLSLTPAGRRAFLEWVHSPTEHVRKLRVEFLAKLFFFRHLALKGGAELVDAQIKTLEEIREGLLEKKDKERDGFRRLVFGIKAMTINTWLRWLCQEAKPFVRKVHSND